jgi:hypothetical protein
MRQHRRRAAMTAHVSYLPATHGPDLDSAPDRFSEDDVDLYESEESPLVYACYPKLTHGTPWAATHLWRLRELVAGAEVVDPEHCGWRNEQEWLTHWPDRSRLSALVIFPDQLGTVGGGCLREISDAIAYGLPVAALDLCCALRESPHNLRDNVLLVPTTYPCSNCPQRLNNGRTLLVVSALSESSGPVRPHGE